VIGRYEQAINRLLDEFNAGFRITGTKHGYPGGVASSSYQILINETPVELGDSQSPLDKPSFRNTLSSGDKSTLALAFFLAQLQHDPEKASKIRCPIEPPRNVPSMPPGRPKRTTPVATSPHVLQAFPLWPLSIAAKMTPAATPIVPPIKRPSAAPRRRLRTSIRRTEAVGTLVGVHSLALDRNSSHAVVSGPTLTSLRTGGSASSISGESHPRVVSFNRVAQFGSRLLRDRSRGSNGRSATYVGRRDQQCENRMEALLAHARLLP